MRSERDVSRRTFIQRLGVLGVAGLGAGSLLTACDSSGSNEEEDDTGVAQTFEVTVQEIDDSYPYSDQNNLGVAYAIDGEVGAVITLERGQTYEFVLGDGVAEGPNGFPHPFYIGNTAEGGGGDEFTEGVENAKSTSGSVLFTPPASASGSLFYLCDNHVYMGGEIEISGGSGSEVNPGY